MDPTLFPQLSILGDGPDYQPATSQKLFFSWTLFCYLYTPTYKAKNVERKRKKKRTPRCGWLLLRPDSSLTAVNPRQCDSLSLYVRAIPIRTHGAYYKNQPLRSLIIPHTTSSTQHTQLSIWIYTAIIHVIFQIIKHFFSSSSFKFFHFFFFICGLRMPSRPRWWLEYSVVARADPAREHD